MTAVDLYTQPRFAPTPTGASTRTDWAGVAAALSAKPGHWAAIGTSTRRGHPLNARQRRLLSLECQVRSNGDGTHTVWCRYTGPATAAHRVRHRRMPPPLVWAPPTLNTLLRFAL